MAATPWLDDYEQRVQDIAARAGRAHDSLSGLTGTGSGASGAVTVTVNAAGALQQVSFGSRAEDLSRPMLADAVLEASRRAHAEVARTSAEALRPVVGVEAADRLLADYQPTPEDTGLLQRDIWR